MAKHGKLQPKIEREGRERKHKVLIPQQWRSAAESVGIHMLDGRKVEIVGWTNTLAHYYADSYPELKKLDPGTPISIVFYHEL